MITSITQHMGLHIGTHFTSITQNNGVTHMTWHILNIPHFTEVYNDYNLGLFMTFKSRDTHGIHNHAQGFKPW